MQTKGAGALGNVMTNAWTKGILHCVKMAKNVCRLRGALCNVMTKAKTKSILHCVKMVKLCAD